MRNILVNVYRRVVDNKYVFQMGLSTLCKHYSSQVQPHDGCQLSGNAKIKSVFNFTIPSIATTISEYWSRQLFPTIL